MQRSTITMGLIPGIKLSLYLLFIYLPDIKASLGDACNNNCTGQNETCLNEICACAQGFYDNNGASPGGVCYQKVGLGSPCPTGDACTGSQVVCSNLNGVGTCVCSGSYYDNNATSQRMCVPKVGLGSLCPTGDACTGSEVVCSNLNGGGICVCSGNYYDNKSPTQRICVPKVGLGSPCPTGDACTGSEVVCSNLNGGGICVCSGSYYDNNATSQRMCVPKFGLGSPCPTGDACNGSQVVCSNLNGGGTCVCSGSYYDNNIPGQRMCVPKVGLGSNCPQPDACVTTNAICDVSSTGIANTCVCNQSYYDNNGVSPNGTCNPLSDLEVTSLSTGTVTEKSITINWIVQTGKEQFIKYFVLTYRPFDNSTSEIVNNFTVANVTLGELVPGQKYGITILSVNTQTALSERRTTSKTFYKISKPSIPGNLLKKEDIEVESDIISLEWNKSEGVVNGYAVSLTNETYKYNKSFGNIATTKQTFTNVTNGTRYIFRVYAFSGDTDTGVLNSETLTDIIKTKVQVPNPPTNLCCSNQTDKTFDLKWQQPDYPNGDITAYIIVIKRTMPGLESYNITLPGTNVQHTVSGLTAGSMYTFYVYIVNELYTSVHYATVVLCQTKAQMAEMPENLQILDVTSRSGTVTWSKPKNFVGIHYGYSLQIHNGSSCIREVNQYCSDCQGSLPNLNSKCTGVVLQKNASTVELLGPQAYTALDLLPDTNYTVTVAAITGNGTGHTAIKNFTTKEEVPSKPSNLHVANITEKYATVQWNVDGARPGQTIYTLIATGISQAEMRTYSISGYFTRKYEMYGLEEYRNYTVIVQANTSIGGNQSDPVSFTTLCGPAGKVNNFNVDKGLGDDMYVKAIVSWKLPDELKRNGPINSFYIQQQHFDNGILYEVNQTKNKENDDAYIYTASFDVRPEANYTFMVRADTGNLHGEVIVKDYSAPAGPPVNIESKGVDVITANKSLAYSKTSFRVEIIKDFFTNTKNGAIKDYGLICCKDPTCKDDRSVVQSFNNAIKNMMTYTQAKMSGSNKYRLPNKITSVEQVSLIRKRAVDNTYVYDVGIESCDGLSIDQYCNGKLDPGSSYRIIAFVCTRSWCTLSKSYGPFITLSEDTNAGSMDMPVIVGIVCGTVLLAILIIAITIIIVRKTQTKERSPDASPGDTYMDLTTRTNDTPYMSYKAPVYDSIPADGRL